MVHIVRRHSGEFGVGFKQTGWINVANVEGHSNLYVVIEFGHLTDQIMHMGNVFHINLYKMLYFDCSLHH